MNYKEWIKTAEPITTEMLAFQLNYKCDKPECEGDDYCIHPRKAKTRKFKKEIIIQKIHNPIPVFYAICDTL